MEQQGLNYTDGNVIVFEQFGDIFQTTGQGRQWKIQQQFADMNMVVLAVCYQGSLHMRINGRDYEANEGDGVACLPSAVIERLMVSPDVHVRGFGISVAAMENMFHTYKSTWQDALVLNENPLVKLTEGQLKVADHLYNIVKLEQEMTECIHYKPMIRSLVQSFLYMLSDIISKHPSEGDLTVPQREQQFKRFIQLLWASGGKERKVSVFASQMCITPKYLSVIVREASGKTPMQLIHNYTSNMIAQRLRATNMSIKEIAHEMNFNNESFFGRYVKKNLGYSPKEYRDKMITMEDGELVGTDDLLNMN